MKILLTGASGFLGTKIYSELISKGFDVVPLYHEKIDITNYILLKKFFKRKNPELVIHTAALTNVDYCEENKEECFRVNVIGTEFLQEICYKQKIKLVFLSTDFVFDGLKGNYREESIRNPINYYGFSKMIAEDIVKKSDKNLIIRASTIFGYFHNKKIDFPSFIIKNLNQGKKIKIAKDLFRKPVFVEDLAKAIIFLIEKKENGIYHCAGPEKISSYNFSLKIAKKFELDKELIIPVESSKIEFKAKRPKDSSLNTEKINKLGFYFKDINSSLKKSNYKKLFVS